MSKSKGNATRLRELRRQVKYLASLISGRGRVYEEMSDIWACDFQNRIVFWRETNPFPPFSKSTNEEILFLIGHESGHLNFTGGWDEPEMWSPQKSADFKHFQNFIEDIRIERLLSEDFAGFKRIRPDFYEKAKKNLWEKIPVEEMPIWKQAAAYWLFRDHNNLTVIPEKMAKFSEEVWPEISRIANARSTKEMTVPLIPLFEKLWQEDPENGGGGADNLDSKEFEGMGNGFGDSPNKNPAKSPMGSGQKPISWKEIIQGIAEDMTSSEGMRILRAIQDADEQAQSKAKNDVLIATGPKAGTTRGHSNHPDNSWDSTKGRMQPRINILSHRLRTVLKNNEMGNWMEGRRRGRMNTHRAMRAVAGNNRIFRQRTILGAKDYTWGIVVDVSGSMSETASGSHRSKAAGALDATVLMAEAFEKANMPYFIVPWETILRERKGIKDKLNRHKSQIGADIHMPNGGTYESTALIASQEEFSKVISGHRVLFVISDGETTGKEESKELLNELEEMGVVVIGIGVGIPAPEHHSKQVSVNSADELSELLPRLVNEFLRKGGGFSPPS